MRLPSLPVPRLPRPALVALMGLLLALVGAFGLIAAPLFSVPTFAASRAVVTCQLQVDAKHCDQQDPRAQQCVSADIITTTVPLADLAGTIVGRLERRHSPHCHTWWARIYDDRQQHGTLLLLQVGTRHFSLAYSDLGGYTDMLYDPSNHNAPLILGTLTTPQGKPDPLLIAGIPAGNAP